MLFSIGILKVSHYNLPEISLCKFNDMLLQQIARHIFSERKERIVLFD